MDVIGQTPKAGWCGTDIVGALAREFICPIGFDTDVNAAALAEHRWGAARDVDNLVYLTVGTGIGGGVIVNGAPIHGLMHPEIGHIYPRRHPARPEFEGVCPFHRDCLEGLASGPAILARTGSSLQQLDAAHPAVANRGRLPRSIMRAAGRDRLAAAHQSWAAASWPRRACCRSFVNACATGWVATSTAAKSSLAADRYVVAPELGDRAGVLGALVLAMDAAARR